MSPWTWQAHAACRGKPLVLFFGHKGERYDQDGKERREREARAVCASCPVAAECCAYADENRLQGIWGGLDDGQRAKARRNATRRERERAARRAERAA